MSQGSPPPVFIVNHEFITEWGLGTFLSNHLREELDASKCSLADTWARLNRGMIYASSPSPPLSHQSHHPDDSFLQTGWSETVHSKERSSLQASTMNGELPSPLWLPRVFRSCLPCPLRNMIPVHPGKHQSWLLTQGLPEPALLLFSLLVKDHYLLAHLLFSFRKVYDFRAIDVL